MEKVFLTKEEIKTITDLQTKEEKFISQLGTLEYQLQILLKQKKELKDSIDPLQVEKEKLAKSLQDKYGEGSIDTSTGEFIKQS
jgi:predicted  nucleic acid-binding Zn-ribbon protein|tara:strand:- start:577 stop:828 length:252 start_codon:yes stop_codon:yes gene_type:complete